MNIVIKEMVEDESYFSNLNIIGQKIYAFKEEFVRMRLAVLNDDLLNEESLNAKACIRLIMEGETVDDFVETKGYSKELTDKIAGCLKEETVYFEDSIYAIQHSF